MDKGGTYVSNQEREAITGPCGRGNGANSCDRGTAYAANKVGGNDLKAFKVGGENPTIVQPGQTAEVTKKCKKGERYISGGWFINGSDVGVPPATFDIIVAGPTLNQKSKPTGFVWGGEQGRRGARSLRQRSLPEGLGPARIGDRVGPRVRSVAGRARRAHAQPWPVAAQGRRRAADGRREPEDS